MPKQKKLKLNELKVKSFITMSNGQSQQVRGGALTDTPIPCNPGTETDTCETPCGSCFCTPDPSCEICVTCQGITCPYSNCKTCECD